VTIKQFRSHPEWPALWRRELDTNNVLRLVLSVMDDAHPAKFAINGDSNEDVSPTRAAIELGATRGYSKFQDGLKLLAEQLAPAVNVGETTYSEPVPEEKPNA